MNSGTESDTTIGSFAGGVITDSTLTMMTAYMATDYLPRDTNGA
jgi:hypothetical protein